MKSKLLIFLVIFSVFPGCFSLGKLYAGDYQNLQEIKKCSICFR